VDRETNALERDIAETRREIDVHLNEMGSRVQHTLNPREQARRFWPGILAGAAVLGLLAGMAVGHGRRQGRCLEEDIKEAARTSDLGEIEIP
jgi:hypothetical protein